MPHLHSEAVPALVNPAAHLNSLALQGLDIRYTKIDQISNRDLDDQRAFNIDPQVLAGSPDFADPAINETKSTGIQWQCACVL